MVLKSLTAEESCGSRGKCIFPPLQDSAYGSLATSQYHRSTGSSSKSRESNLRCRFLFALTQD